MNDENLTFFELDFQYEVSINNISQFELTADYFIKPQKEELINQHFAKIIKKQFSKTPHFDIKLFFFFPKNLNINKHTFPPQNIYFSTKNHIRIHTPPFEKFEKGHIPLADYYFSLDSNIIEKQKIRTELQKDIKLFANLVNSKIKVALSLNNENQIEGILAKIEELISNFRNNYISKVHDNNIIIERSIKKEFKLIDEYLALQLEAFFQSLLLKNQNSHWADRLKTEKEYIKTYYKLPGILEGPQKREKFFHRRRNLKKFVSNVLYLDKESRHKDKMYSNIMASFAAALAALWANAITLNSRWAQGPQNIGLEFYVMLLIAVMAYVFKDRIKDTSKEYLQSKLKNFLPDFEYLYFLPALTQKDKKGKYKAILRSQENVSYVKWHEIPDEIKYIKQNILKDYNEIYVEDNIFKFSKGITLSKDFLNENISKKSSFKDLLRFNTDMFTSGFDDPTKKITDYSESDEIIYVDVPKHYYFDVILQVNVQNSIPQNKHNISRIYQAFRLVLNKNGLYSIEKLFHFRNQLSKELTYEL